MTEPQYTSVRLCAAPGCTKPADKRKNLCSAHRYRRLRYGSFDLPSRPTDPKYAHRSEYIVRPTQPFCPPNEEWRPVVGYEGMYEVSFTGQVRSASGRAIAIRVVRGYHRISLYRNRTQSHSVHGLVAAAFIGPRPPACEINHKDGDRANNHVANLEYVTRSENNLHKNRVLGSQAGENNPTAKLNAAQVEEIRRRYIPGTITQQQLADEYGVTRCRISMIANGLAWVASGQEKSA